VTDRPIDDTAGANRDSAAAVDCAGEVSARRNLGSIGSIRSSATAASVRSTKGSLSRSSIETHATSRSCCAAHCANTVVLPYPDGATADTTGW
jgi:hypothetical protein